MRKALLAAVLVALPVMAQAQTAVPGFYIGAEGGVNWLLNTTILNNGVNPRTGFAAGGVVGYDFVGPRIDLEGVYRYNQHNVGFPGRAISNRVGQLGILANLLYDFAPNSTVTPYVGAGAGVAFVDSDRSLGSAQFAYQGIIGLGWNVDANFRVNLDGRYYATSNPNVDGSAWSNNNFTIMVGLQVKFGAAASPPPRAQPTDRDLPFWVFFDWDSTKLSAQALSTIRQVASGYKVTGAGHIRATGHTDKSGPEAYNMALSLRRANAVKYALVSEGVPTDAIRVVGKGESQPLVTTDDGIREPLNRGVEIVIQ